MLPTSPPSPMALRGYMTLLLIGGAFTAVAGSELGMMVGITSLGARYGAGSAFGYLGFLLIAMLWLAPVGAEQRRAKKAARRAMADGLRANPSTAGSSRSRGSFASGGAAVATAEASDAAASGGFAKASSSASK